MTADQLASLRKKLIDIETRKSIAELKWDDIESGITLLSARDKDDITKAIISNGTSVIPLISDKLTSIVGEKAAAVIDGYLTAGAFPTDYIARIID